MDKEKVDESDNTSIVFDVFISYDRRKSECVPVLSLLPVCDEVNQKEIIRNCTKGKSDIAVGPFDLYKIGTFDVVNMSLQSRDKSYLVSLYKGDLVDDPEFKCDKE